MHSRHAKKTPVSHIVGFIAAVVILLAMIIGVIVLLDKLSSDSGSEPASASDIISSEPATASDVISSEPEPLDTTAPEISGVKDISIYIGDSVAYRSGVTVTDDTDPAPTLKVDSSKVDLTSAGSYEIVYSATDAAGNTATASATVTVRTKAPDHIDEETVYAAADKKLKSLVNDDMTDRQKVTAIYNWARGNIGYSGSSDKTDWLQTAYKVLNGSSTDCFGYYAVTKLLLERLEIPNIDVRKVKNYENDSDHFWSLVSVDGGETYYHFDATPRKGTGDDFCLVTDAFLDAYSDAHKKCHNRDKSLYPATPEE